MRRAHGWMTWVAYGLAGLSGTSAADMEWVTISDPGNPPDGTPYDHGRVDYMYEIGKHEVTAGAYTEFLNAVAATDTYALYNTLMASDLYGCRIERSGVPGQLHVQR